jgi:hypothetical protein
MNRYYIADGAARTGPFDVDELRARATILAPDTLVWTAGMNDWLPAERVPELLPLLARAEPSAALTTTTPLPLPDTTAATTLPDAMVCDVVDDFILANPRLPRMAQLLCVYVLLVNPALWLLYNVSCLMTTNWDDKSPAAPSLLLLNLVWTVVSFACALIMALGGWQLRKLKRSGATMLTAGLAVNVVTTVLLTIGAILIGVAYGVTTTTPEPARPPGAVEVLNVFMLTVFVLVFAYEVIALIWLLRGRQRLPLS